MRLRNAVAATMLLGSFAGCRSNMLDRIGGYPIDHTTPPVQTKVTLYDCCVPATDFATAIICEELKGEPGYQLTEKDGSILRASCMPK